MEASSGATPVQPKKKNRPIRARAELAPRQLDLERQTPGEADSQSDRSSSPEPTVSWSDPTPLEVDIVWTGSVYHYVDPKVQTTSACHSFASHSVHCNRYPRPWQSAGSFRQRKHRNFHTVFYSSSQVLQFKCKLY